MARSLAATAALLVAVTASVVADAKLTRTGAPQVAFHANATAGMKLVGTTSELDVDDRGAEIVIKVPLRNLTTGIALRDHHMRDKYLQVGTYPDAVLTVPRSALQLPAGDGTSSGDATGAMAIHGRTKDVRFHYTVTRAGGTYRASGATHLDIRDFGIAVPSYLGVTVKPDIDVDVQFAASET